MKGTLKPPEIPEKDQSPLVEQLLAFIEHQSIVIQQLKDEIARLKNQPPGRLLNPVILENQKSTRQNLRGINGPGSKKRSKTAHLKIHKTDPHRAGRDSNWISIQILQGFRCCVFRRIVTTHSAANCPPIPLDCDHPFRNIVTTHSAAL
jgi:hypothetical protein